MQTSRPFALIASIAVLALGSAACNDDPGPSTGSPPPSSPIDRDDPRGDVRRSDTDRPTSSSSAAAPGAPRRLGRRSTVPVSQRRCRTSATVHQTNPDWSPDGTRVVFAMTDGTTDDLFVADVGATEATKLLDCVVAVPLPRRPGLVTRRQHDRLQPHRRPRRRRGQHPRGGRGGHRRGDASCSGRGPSSSPPAPDGPRTDGRIVFEMVSKTGPELDADLSGVTLSVLRLESTKDQCAASPTRRSSRPRASPTRHCSRRPRTGARTGGGSSTPPSRSPGATRRPTCSGSARWAVPAQQLTHLVDAGGYAAEPDVRARRPGSSSAVGAAPTRASSCSRSTRTGPDWRWRLATSRSTVGTRASGGPQRRVNAKAS